MVEQARAVVQETHDSDATFDVESTPAADSDVKRTTNLILSKAGHSESADFCNSARACSTMLERALSADSITHPRRRRGECERGCAIVIKVGCTMKVKIHSFNLMSSLSLSILLCIQSLMSHS